MLRELPPSRGTILDKRRRIRRMGTALSGVVSTFSRATAPELERKRSARKSDGLACDAVCVHTVSLEHRILQGQRAARRTRHRRVAVTDQLGKLPGGRRPKGTTVGDEVRGRDGPPSLTPRVLPIAKGQAPAARARFPSGFVLGMATCLIGLGSNLGDRRRALDQAVERLTRRPPVRLTARSRWYETVPVGGPPGQGPFLNGAAVLETSLEPEALFSVLGGIEADLGRRRAERWGPRPLDLDLLLYGELVLESPSLTIPHPRMAWRRFVLESAAEVAADMVHPTTGWPIARLLDHLNTAVPYVAITGPIGVGKTQLADQVALLVQGTSATRILERVSPRRLEAFCADPSGNAWATELEFLHERGRLLSAALPSWSERGRLWVSDFWFNQCLAYAGVWLAPERLDEYRRRWEDARRTVVTPKLTVLLDAPADWLLERIERRGRRGERRLSAATLERVRQAILAEAGRPGQGPVLRLAGEGPARTLLREVLGAVEAMQ